ncbi:MAG: DUF4189 domain-containing protein [Sphingopyxis sp.]|nr:DUF4189 domain-containing protein [Sphingopyxis sp.]
MAKKFEFAVPVRVAIAGFAALVAAGVSHDALRAQVDEPIIIECPQGTEPTYFGCQIPPPPGVTYLKNWGALAVNTGTRDWLVATGHAKEEKAKKALVKACQDSGQNCTIYLTFLNQCVSVARVSDPKIAAAGKETIHNGTTFDETQSNAVAKCKSDWGAKSCAPVVTQCSINQIQR